MNPELGPDDYLEQDETPVDTESNDRQLDTSPFDKKDKGSKKSGGKDGQQSGRFGKKNKQGTKAQVVKGKAAAKGKGSSLKDPKKLLKGGGTAGKTKKEQAINQALSQAAKLIPYVGKALSLLIKKVGIKRLGFLLLVIILIPVGIVFFLSIVPLILYKAPKAVLSMAWQSAKNALGISINSTIQNGAASKLAYEYEVGSNKVIAAPDGEKPKEGTLAYKYSLVDWEKAKYQTQPIDSNCEVKTKKVVSAVDGKQRSVVDKVVFNISGREATSSVVKAHCIEQSYPIFNAMMRSQFLREGVNKELAVRFAYAEPKDAKTIDGKKQEEVDKVLRDKTLKRIWNANLKTTLADSAGKKAAAEAAAAAAEAAKVAAENAKKNEGANRGIEEIIALRNKAKAPCDSGTSFRACEGTINENLKNLYDANNEIIKQLEPRYKSKIPRGNSKNQQYYSWKMKDQDRCNQNVGVQGPCPSGELRTAADNYAEYLLGFYNADKQAAADANSGAASPAPTAAAPSSPESSWPTDCQEKFEPSQGDEVDKSIAIMVNDLLCGLNPKDIVLKGIELPQEQRGADPEHANDELTTASIKLLCQFTTRLLTNDSYKTVLRYRIASAANAAWQIATYADTMHYRYVGLNETGGDFYKISSFQSAQEYNVPVNSETTGDPLEQMAIGDAIGTQRTFLVNGTGLDGGTGDHIYQQFVGQDGKGVCQDIIKANGEVAPRGSIEEALSKNPLFGGLLGYKDIPTGSRLNYHYKHEYQDLKKAIAALPYYTQKEPDVEKTARNMTLGDVLAFLVKARANVSDTGTEDGAQNFNRMSLGMKAYMNANSAAIGGQFLRAEQSMAMEVNAETARRYDEKSKGIGYRLLNTSNPRSLASRLSAAATASPAKAAKNMASIVLNLFNPIDSIVSGRKSFAYYMTGENNTAIAAGDYDRNNLRIDPSGLPDEMLAIDPLKNASEIEAMKEKGENSDFFGVWDGCFKKFIATEQLHLQEDNPECIILFTSNKELQKDYNFDNIVNLANNDKFKFLKPIADKLTEAAKSDASIKSKVVWPYGLATKYRANHYYNLQADALIYLSDPNKVDETLNANVGKGGGAASAGTTGDTGPNPNVQVDKATSCTGGPKPGTQQMADFVMQKFGTSNMGIYNCRNVRGGSSKSLHAEGRAFDAGVSAGNPESKARGDQLFMWAMVNAANLGFQEIIWNRQIWTPSKGLHPYGGSNPHTDHVHLGQNNAGAAGQTPFYTSGAGKN